MKDKISRKRREKKLKVVFMGTPDFAMKSLEAIYQKGYEMIRVITNTDKPQGRGMKLTPSPVKQFALEHHLQVEQPQAVKANRELIEELKSLRPDVICVVAYGKILPKEILEIPRYGCINVHASLLPKYRGAAPIQWAVLNGDKTTGVSTMYMDEGMDTGDIILTQEVAISEEETTGELWDRLAELGAQLLVRTLEEIESGTAPRHKQGENFSMAPMLSKQMAKIDWEAKDAQQITNLVRGLNPIMGAYTYYKGKKIKFWKVKPEARMCDQEVTNGTIVKVNAKEGIVIKTKKGMLRVLEIQGENAKRMSIQDYLRGNAMQEGDTFSDGF